MRRLALVDDQTLDALRLLIGWAIIVSLSFLTIYYALSIAIRYNDTSKRYKVRRRELNRIMIPISTSAIALLIYYFVILKH